MVMPGWNRVSGLAVLPAVKTSRDGRSLGRAAVLVALLLSATGCAANSSVPSPSGVATILSVETRGGECADGPCGTTIFVEWDGHVHQAAKPPNDLGVVTPAALAALGAAVRATDFAELMGHPFTGMCPTAYDGQELVFEFGTPVGIQRIASCEVEIDYGSPLFRAVATAVGHFISLPIP
jgi:hypothetical protein